MRRWLILLRVASFAVLTFLWTNPVSAQLPDRQSPHVYRIVSDNCTHSPKYRTQTAFRVQGVSGLVTALHGVADCETITAISDVTDERLEGLTLAEVDIARDIAIVSASAGDLADSGYDVADANNTVYRELEVIGYPYGREKQAFVTSITITEREALANIVRGPDRSRAFIARKSPSLDIEVFNLQASTVPGHSGAPVITADGKLLGMVDGGLKEGTIEVAWAIPWEDVQLVAVETVEFELNRIRQLNPELALLFSSTIFTAADYGPVPVRNITADAFDSYQMILDADADLVMSGIPLTGEFLFSGTYNAQNPQVERSLFASGNFPLIGPAEMGYATIGQNSYAVLNGICIPQNEMANQLSQQLNDMYAVFGNLIRASNSTGPLEGTMLGPDVVDDVPAKHYGIPASSWTQDDGQVNVNAKESQIWLSVEGNYLLRMDFDLEFSDPTGMQAGRMAGTLMVTDIGESISIKLPDNCASLGTTLDAAPLTPNLLPAATPAPMPLPPPQRIPETTPSSSRPTATIGAIWVDHDVEQDGLNGMLIHVPFVVNNLQGVEANLDIYFYDDTGTPLTDQNGMYAATDGSVAVRKTFTPSYPGSRYKDFTLFMPYDELDLPTGKYALQFIANIYDPLNERYIAESTPVSFTFTQTSSEPTPSLPSLFDSLDNLPSGTVEIISIDYDVFQDDVYGMNIHLQFQADNLEDVPAWAVVYFELADGTPLQDYDGVYTNSDGTISASAEFTPIYASAVYEDFTIFMPYSQLHMVAGTHDLRMVAQLVDQPTLTPFATSNYVDFWYEAPPPAIMPMPYVVPAVP